MNSPNSPHGPRAVVLVGATASGKTDLAVAAALACERPVEILALDSRQLYRDLEVATGKPSAVQRDAVPHHLLDLLEAHEKPQAQWYRERATVAMEAVLARGAVPFFVGGSGFYLRALREGFFEIGATSEELARARARVAELDDVALRATLAALDPEAAARLHPHDRYRIGRALEIAWLTGETATVLQARFEARPLLGADLEVLVIGTERSLLHARIEARTARWLAGGWREEVEAMLGRGIDRDSPALRTLGYREVLRWIEGDLDREHAAAQIVIGTRRYARQQETWLRKEGQTRWIKESDVESVRRALERGPGTP